MPLKRAIPTCTKAQQHRQDAARARGCIACQLKGEYVALPVAIHHQVDTGRQISQDHTVCLCDWHHQGYCLPGKSSEWMTEWFGPSLAKSPREFYRVFGSNDEQLAYQNQLIGYAMPKVPEKRRKGRTATPSKIQQQKDALAKIKQEAA